MWQRVGRVSVQKTADILAVHGPMPPIPANVFLRDAEGEPFAELLDFGIAKTGIAPDDTSRLHVMRNARR